jgi:predicted dehydrogenase
VSNTTNTRRDFMKAAGVAAAVAAAPAVHAAGNETIKVGLVGCGGRGRGAINDCLRADKSVRVHAIADVFADKAEGTVGVLKDGGAKDRVDIEGRVFSGLDAYKKVVDSGVNLVILATPPGFRPQHLEYAINAGKHVFTEKPVAVDGPGIAKCIELAEVAKRNGKAVVAGTQRRHQKAYNEVYKRIADGLIGDIVGGRCAWNNDGIWFNKRKDGQSDVEYQLRNWYHFLWLCGDHITEQHVHNLDVINWFTGKRPQRAVAMGGRMGGTKARPDGDPNEVGNIWDHFAVEFDYGDGVKVASYCRHYPGVGDVSEMVVGTKGTIRTSDKGFYELIKDGKVTELYSVAQDKKDTNPYVQEHIDLIQSIRAGKPLNELKQVAESTLTAILGREAAYTGRSLRWEDALKSKHGAMPEHLTMDMKLPVDPVPVPGKTKTA